MSQYHFEKREIEPYVHNCSFKIIFIAQPLKNFFEGHGEFSQNCARDSNFISQQWTKKCSDDISHFVIKLPVTLFLHIYSLVSSVHACFLFSGFTQYLCGCTNGSNEISHAMKLKLNFAFMSLTSLIVYKIYSSSPGGR